MDIPYAISRLLFFTIPTDRALTGWQPYQPSHYYADMDDAWRGAVEAEARHIARALQEDD